MAKAAHARLWGGRQVIFYAGEVTDEERARSGGVSIMHFAAEMFNRVTCTRAGQVFTEGASTPRFLRRDKDIVVYPETIEGNPLGVVRVVRWLLYFPRMQIAETWSETDSIVAYNHTFVELTDAVLDRREEFCEWCQSLNWARRQLPVFNLPEPPRVPLPSPEDITPLEAREDGPVLFTIRKGDPSHRPQIREELVGQPQVTQLLKEVDEFVNGSQLAQRPYADAELLELPRGVSLRDTVSLLAQARLLVTYDPFTFLSVIAVMCGCPVLVVPLPNITSQRWQEHLPMQSHGVAYGLARLHHAFHTLPLAREWLERDYLCDRVALERTAQFAELLRGRFWDLHHT
jgi:hypothetical protein